MRSRNLPYRKISDAEPLPIGYIRRAISRHRRGLAYVEASKRGERIPQSWEMCRIGKGGTTEPKHNM